MTDTLRLGIVGGGRAHVFQMAADNCGDAAVVAICDNDLDVLSAWAGSDPQVRRYNQIDALLADPAVDAVVIATPIPSHADLSLMTLAAGKHVLSEIPALTEIAEAGRLWAAVNSSKQTYMLAENYLYIPEVRYLVDRSRSGAFGAWIFAAARYIHDCRALHFDTDGRLSWRGLFKHGLAAHTYPTHSLGPVARCLDLGRSDRIVQVVAAQNQATALPAYAAARGYSQRYSQAHFWAHGDRVVVLATTERGVLIRLEIDTHSPRPANKLDLELQGTRGVYLSPRVAGEDGLLWHSESDTEAAEPVAVWQPARPAIEAWLAQEADRDPLAARGASPDVLLLRDFIRTVRGEIASPIDVRDAIRWSLILPLSAQSLTTGGLPVVFPAEWG